VRPVASWQPLLAERGRQKRRVISITTTTINPTEIITRTTSIGTIIGPISMDTGTGIIPILLSASRPLLTEVSRASDP
jgi:hydrogenase-4 membrane subunit HyfE